MHNLYFRIVCKNTYKYFYYRTLPKNILNDSNYWIEKLDKPIQLIQLTKYNNLRNKITS